MKLSNEEKLLKSMSGQFLSEGRSEITLPKRKIKRFCLVVEAYLWLTRLVRNQSQTTLFFSFLKELFKIPFVPVT